jgi:glucose-1-phosphate thymidylyltransferase
LAKHLRNDNFIGLIPAAGRGLRLGLPYPKELYPIIKDNKYKPVSQYIVDQMTNIGMKHLVFIINETKHQLIGFFGNGDRFGCRFSYVVQETVNPMSSTSPGLAQALDSAYHLSKDKVVFFGMPDTIMQPNDIFKRSLPLINENADVIMCLFKTKTPQKFGMVGTNSDGNVIEIIDKPSTTDLTHMWGCIIWKPVFTEFLHESLISKKVFDFAVIMNSAIKANLKFKALKIDDGFFYDLGTYDEIIVMDKQLRGEYDPNQ